MKTKALLYFLPLTAGVLQGFSFAPARAILQLIALSVLFICLSKSHGVKQAFAQGFLFGLGWFCYAISWVYVSIHTYGYQPAFFAAAAAFFFAAFLSIFPAAAAAFSALFTPALKKGFPLAFVLGTSASWGIFEWLRGWVLSGFPWAASAYAHVEGSLSGYAPIVGATGINFLSALIAVLIAVFVLSFRDSTRRLVCLAAMFAVITGGIFFGRIQWYEPAAQVRFQLIQGGVLQDEKFSPMGTLTSFERYLTLMKEGRAAEETVTVLPETIFPIPLDRLPKDIWKRFTEGTDNGSRMIFGGFTRMKDGYANSVVEVSKGRIIESYSKRHLVPFGEYVPFGFRWFIDMLGIPMGDLVRGSSSQAAFNLGNAQAALLLCYEDLFAEEVRDWWTDASSPNVLINLSNLGWFGDSLALPQHLNISRMRAIEFARPVVRASNTGATAYVEPDGTVAAELPFMAPGKLDVTVTTAKGAPTPYARNGDLPSVIFMFLLFFAAIALAITRKTKLNRLQ